MGKGGWMHDESPRIYRRWGGNPKGNPEDVTCCIEPVSDGGRSPLSSQCSRPRGKGLDGLYCGIHARRYPAAPPPAQRTDNG